MRTGEDFGRDRKVSCLLAQLDITAAKTGADDAGLLRYAEGMTDDEWRQLAIDANGRHSCNVTHGVPSADTRAAVLSLLRRRVDRADPFDTR